MELVTKSRDLSLTDFYSILQKEFISYYIRSKTYPPEYSKKYENYCICKKEKIEKIGQKNSLPSIFNSQTTKDRFLDQFFNAYGLPNFEYRDDVSLKIIKFLQGFYQEPIFRVENVSKKGNGVEIEEIHADNLVKYGPKKKR